MAFLWQVQFAEPSTTEAEAAPAALREFDNLEDALACMAKVTTDPTRPPT